MGCGASKENQPAVSTSLPLQQQKEQQQEPVPLSTTTPHIATNNSKKSPPHPADTTTNNNTNKPSNKPVESYFPPPELTSNTSNNNNNKEIPSSKQHNHTTAAASSSKKKEETAVTAKKSSKKYVPPAPITATPQPTPPPPTPINNNNAAVAEAEQSISNSINNNKNIINNNKNNTVEEEQSLQQILDLEEDNINNNQSGLLDIDEEELNQLQQINNKSTDIETEKSKETKSSSTKTGPTRASSKTKTTKLEGKKSITTTTTSSNMSSSQSKYIFEYPDEIPEPNSTSGMRFEEIYRLKGVLGTGAFSTVREGYHRSNTSISYAIKCINRKKLSQEDEIALLDEVSILKEMKDCKHIIRLFDFFEEANTYYLVMERMRGGELFDRIVAKAYYNEKEARDTCKIILEAIQYCHSHHVAHRDLKPENLLLLSDLDDSQVKIADFGFAKKVYEPNSLSTQCGTPGYVAPEILEGTKYDERADMWSVGVILYILLGGYPPFIESTQRDLFRKIRKGEYEFHEEYWGTVSKEAKQLIQSLLTVDVNKRLTAKQALEQNAWILDVDSDKLANKFVNLEKLRNFNAKRKFRAAVHTVMAANKLNLVGKEFLFSASNDNLNFIPDDDAVAPDKLLQERLKE